MAAKKKKDDDTTAYLLRAALAVSPESEWPKRPFHDGGSRPNIGAHAYVIAALWLSERARPVVDPRDVETFEHFVALARHQLRVGPADTSKQGDLFQAQAKKSSRIPCKIGIWCAHEASNCAWRGLYAGGAARPAFAGWAKYLLKTAPSELRGFLAEVHALCIHLEALTVLRERERETSSPIATTLWRGCEDGRATQFLMRLENGKYALFGKQGARWQLTEGDRDHVVAIVPDTLFDRAVKAAVT